MSFRLFGDSFAGGFKAVAADQRSDDQAERNRASGSEWIPVRLVDI